MIHLLLALCLAMSIHAAERSSEGLILLYNFVGDDEEVVDRSGFGEPLNLKIANSANVFGLFGTSGFQSAVSIWGLITRIR